MQFLPQRKQRVSITNIHWLMFTEIIVVYTEKETKPIYTLCGQNAELLNVKAVWYIVTTELQTVNM
jgi:hypothetical protein